MNLEKRLKAASQMVSLSSLADDPFIVRAQDLSFKNVDWDSFYREITNEHRILIDFIRAIIDNEPGCDTASISYLSDYDREAVVHGLTIAFTSKDGMDNG